MSRSYRDLKVWQKSIEMVTACYQICRQFPDHEKFGLRTQLQRAAVSVPANIAEGNGRGSAKYFINFLWIANGSLTEVETHIHIAFQLGYITSDTEQKLLAQTQEIGRMLTGLRRSLDQNH